MLNTLKSIKFKAAVFLVYKNPTLLKFKEIICHCVRRKMICCFGNVFDAVLLCTSIQSDMSVPILCTSIQSDMSVPILCTSIHSDMSVPILCTSIHSDMSVPITVTVINVTLIKEMYIAVFLHLTLTSYQLTHMEI